MKSKWSSWLIGLHGWFKNVDWLYASYFVITPILLTGVLCGCMFFHKEPPPPVVLSLEECIDVNAQKGKSMSEISVDKDHGGCGVDLMTELEFMISHSEDPKISSSRAYAETRAIIMGVVRAYRASIHTIRPDQMSAPEPKDL